MNKFVRTAVLISGRGSNLQALIDAAAEPNYPAKIALVISNIPGVAGLTRAADAGIPALAIDQKTHSDKPRFEAVLHAALLDHEIEMICLAGFMRLLSADFLAKWSGKVLNIHPSLLPSFKGLDTHKKALDAGVRISGCTVHFVTPEMDAGPIIAQAAVPVALNDSEDSLAARILEREHEIYPLSLKMVCEGRTRIENGRVTVSDGTWSGASLVNPSS